MSNEELPSDGRDRLQRAIDDIDALSGEVGAEGSFEIIEELYLLVTKILERYPELEEDESIE
jgi:hypothetical protein